MNSWYKRAAVIAISFLLFPVMTQAQSVNTASATVPSDVVTVRWWDDPNPSVPGHSIYLVIAVGNTSNLVGTFYVYESVSVPLSGTAIDSIQINNSGDNLLFTSNSNVGAATRFSVKFVSDNSSYVDTNIDNIRPQCSEGRFSESGFGPCTKAPAGSFVDTPGATVAVPCPPGRYQPDTGQMMCLQAAPGSYVSTTGATSATLCPRGTSESNAGAMSCIPARVGRIVPEEGSLAEIPCPSGYTTSGLASSVCYLSQNALTSSPTATWNSSSSGSVTMTFTNSPPVAGTVTVYQSAHIAGSPAVAGTGTITAGATSVNVSLTSANNAMSDFYSIKFESNNSNHNVTYWENIHPQCGEGFFSGIGFTPCGPAPAGTYVAQPGSTEATNCEPGTYQPLTGQSSCLAAPSGTYVSSAGSTTPTNCPTGHFGLAIGAISSDVCIASAPGNFVSSNDRTRQQLCAKGTFQPLSGQASCLQAKIGYFVKVEGATQQTKCKRRYTTSSIASTSCKLSPKLPGTPRALAKARSANVYLKNYRNSDGLRVTLKASGNRCKVQKIAGGYKITGLKKGKCSISIRIKGNKTFASVNSTRQVRIV